MTTDDIEFSSEIEVKYIQHMGSDLAICNAAKVSFDGAEAPLNEDTSAGLINFLMRNRHGSPFEHGGLTVFVSAPIFVFREWHRHRVGFSYNEESGRYKVLEPKFYKPASYRPLVQEGKPGAYNFIQGQQDHHDSVEDWFPTAGMNYDAYLTMLGDGVAKEVARMVLPLNIYSSMYVTCNPRSIMHFLSLRTKSDNAKFKSYPMWEIENAATKLELIFSDLWPETWKAFCTNGRVAP